MASPLPSPPTIPPFLRLPTSIRRRIYGYLLPPQPSESIVYINYTLHWPWFENPSNTTFNGTCQLDLCRCPQNPDRPRTRNSKTEDHIYSRYRCYGPEVGFKSAREDLWVPAERYGKSGQINFLKPGRRWNRGEAPSLGILSVCRTVYHEAVGALYRGRNFCFLTGPCPRGRYQAYATQYFLSRLSPSARSHVTTLSINALPYEEDANPKDARQAYANLAAYVQLCLPSFEKLYLNVWDVRLKDAVKALDGVYEKEGVKIVMAFASGEKVECGSVGEFAKEVRQLRGAEPDRPRHTRSKSNREGSEKSTIASKAERTSTKRSLRSKSAIVNLAAVWEEVHEEVGAGEQSNIETVVNQKREQKPSNTVLRKFSKVQRVLSKRGQGKDKAGDEEGEDESEMDEEWVDATLSPTAETWEVL